MEIKFPTDEELEALALPDEQEAFIPEVAEKMFGQPPVVPATPEPVQIKFPDQSELTPIPNEPSLWESAKAGFARTRAGANYDSAADWSPILDAITEMEQGTFEYDPVSVRKTWPGLRDWQYNIMRNFTTDTRPSHVKRAEIAEHALEYYRAGRDWNEMADAMGTNPAVAKVAEAMKAGGIEAAKGVISTMTLEAFAHFMASSLGAMAPNAPYLAIPMGGALGAFIRQGIAAGKTDFESEVSQYLAEIKMDPRDEMAALQALGTPQFDEFRRRKAERAAMVGGAAGVGGALAHSMGGSGVKKIAGEFAAGATTDSVGEAVGQKLDEPDKPINWGEVLLEAGLGGPQQIIESAVTQVGSGRKPKTDEEGKPKDTGKELTAEQEAQLGELKKDLELIQAGRVKDPSAPSITDQMELLLDTPQQPAATQQGIQDGPPAPEVADTRQGAQMDLFRPEVNEAVKNAENAIKTPESIEESVVNQMAAEAAEADARGEPTPLPADTPVESVEDLGGLMEELNSILDQITGRQPPDPNKVAREWQAHDNQWNDVFHFPDTTPADVATATQNTFAPLIDQLRSEPIGENDLVEVYEPLQMTLERAVANMPDSQIKELTKRTLEIMSQLNKMFPKKAYTLALSTDEAIRQKHGPEYTTDGTRGLADANNREVTLRLGENRLNNGLSLPVLLHEAIHAVTLDILVAFQEAELNEAIIGDANILIQKYPRVHELYTELNKSLKTIREEVKNYKGNDPFIRQVKDGRNNSLENPAELLAWLADGRFRRMLKDMVPEKNFVARLLNKWMDAVKQIFGIRKSDESMLARVLGIYGELTDWSVVGDFYAMEFGVQSNVTPRQLTVHAHKTAPNIINVRSYDLTTAISNYISDYNAAKAIAGTTRVKEPHQHEWEILNKALGKSTGKHVAIPLNDVKVIDDVLHGNRSTLPQNAQAANHPFAFVTSPKESFLVQMFDDPALTLRMKSNFPSLRIYNVAEAANSIAKGITTDEAARTWRKNDAASRALDILGQITIDSKTNLEEFEDIDDPYVAKQLLLNDGKDLKQNITDPFSAGSESKAALSNNPLIRWWRGAVTKAKRSQEEMADAVIKPIMWDYRKLTKSEQIATMQAMLLGDQFQVQLTPTMLKQRGFNDTQIDIIQRFYEADRWLIDQNNLVRAKWGLEPVERREGHFPGIFNDDYSAVMYVKNAKDELEVVGVVGASTKRGLEANKEFMMSKIPDLKFSETQIKKLIHDPRETADVNAVFEALTEILDPNNPAVQKAQQAQQQHTIKMAQQHLGFSKFNMPKKGVIGSAGKKPWQSDYENAEDQFLTAMNYLKQGAFHHGIMDNLGHLGTLLRDPELVSKRPKTLKYLHSQLFHVTNKLIRGAPKGATSTAAQFTGKAADTLLDGMLETVGIGKSYPLKASAQIREAFSYMAMSFYNIAFGALQFFQVATAASPLAAVFRQKLGIDITRNRQAPINAAMQMMKLVTITRTTFGNEKHKEHYKTHPWYKAMPLEEKMLVQYIIENGMLEFGTIENTSSQVIRQDTTTEKVKHHSDILRRLPEKMTRPFVFYWLYNISKDAGMSTKKALNVAQHGTDFSMVNYHQVMRPSVYSALGSMGSLFGQLKSFMHATLALQMYLYSNPKAYKGIATMMTMYVIVAGVEGMIGYNEMDDLIRYFNRNYRGVDYGLKEATKEHLPDMLRMGLISAVTGRDFYSRARMPALTDPGTYMAPSIGWAAKTWEYMYDMVADWPSSTPRMALVNNNLPTSLRAAVTDPYLRSDKDGNLVDSKGQILFYDYFDDYDLVRRMGFRRPQEAEVYRQADMRRSSDQYYSDRRDSISTEMAQWLANGNSMDHPKVQSWIKEYTRLYGSPAALMHNVKKKIKEFSVTHEDRSKFMYKGLRSARQGSLENLE